MSINLHKRHNISVLLYHFVFPTQFRKVVIDNEIDKIIKDVCLEIANRYELHFVEIGSDKDHVHFLVQSVPTFTITKLVTTIKSITAKEIFFKRPDLKKQMWGSNFWTSGYYVSTVGAHGNEHAITHYVKQQGKEKEYYQIHKDQLTLFI
ncbi:IS200/IS605 family transposase [Candidatus Roizmanbacteria bacterium CG_4_9_14_0_2_um_filter_39_13]|uniref:IS200/IS605 family transposase n=2 Tax=Candidatus Roizmaniibacteriota TaxID=1752723 RepID=A0A2M8F3I2_9BACT|nr:MAG: IS200/IS605 family transposase [Candidatus Roizmanbacteria bacterium CG_4_10_14_0_2_um_filter_39_12]PJC33849.1 MAG: IS200/IS605 family transposase [Candidatus Roizmanbacteria bacterium CG_4_9_14_0_2_um_filter_39_13]PJE61728.1 MAG: IS200/IS605 family transposase [Candidatus Roizmanbacteria bacterium CG10_big_fil_rev_8_21_14_0_10_39_12]